MQQHPEEALAGLGQPLERRGAYVAGDAMAADGTAHLLHAEDSLRGEPVLPCFSCRVGDLF